jgi:RND superfamily putative drug exporter
MRIVGEFVSRRRGWVLGAWVALAAGLWLLVPAVDPGASELSQYLPLDSPSQQAVGEMRRLFPDVSGQGEAVVAFERTGAKLTALDLQAVEAIARAIALPKPSDDPGTNLTGIHVRSPSSIPLPHNPLISEAGPQGQAALIVVQVPADFVSIRSARIVHHIRGIVAATTLPAGLSAAVTGSSGYGCDYAEAAEESNKRTSVATVAAVLLILVLVYRAPLAALIPLAAVSLAAIVVLKLRVIFSHLGLHSGTAESIFVFVLLYGAGTDYSLLLISRYREYVMSAMDPRRAVAAAINSTLPAIVASGITNSLGLLTLCTAQFKIFQTTGPAVAVALGIMMLAALTLVPALLSFFSGAIFWPRRKGGLAATQRGARVSGESAANTLPSGSPLNEEDRPALATSSPVSPLRRGSPLWRRVAILVTARPLRTLAICAGLFCIPAFAGARVEWVYDQLTTLSPKYGAVRGMEMVKRHWGVGELGPANILVEAAHPLTAAQWRDFSAKLTEAFERLPGVQDVRSLSQPVGKTPPEPPSLNPLTLVSGLLTGPMVQQATLSAYVSADRQAMQATVILRDSALTLQAMSTVVEVRRTAETLARAALPGGKVLVGGATAYMEDEREVTSSDFHRIAILTVSVIFLILLILLRRPVLALFMAACTLLGYLAALGITLWVFTGLLGSSGLDWKVQIFLFVVMVAVGVDYSIFLGARLVEETGRRRGGASAGPAGATGAHVGAGAAIRRAVVHTGPVISSCGVIMAATLGTLMTGDLVLLHQLGFAMALGMLLDTFVVRPLLVPSFAMILAWWTKRK